MTEHRSGGARRGRAATYWQRLRGQPIGLAGLVIFVLFLLIAILGPLIAPYGYADQSVALLERWEALEKRA